MATNVPKSTREAIESAVAEMGAAGLLQDATKTGLDAPVVRRTQRAVSGIDHLAPATLFSEDGVLRWHAGPSRAALPARRTRAASAAPSGQWVTTIPFERLERNKIGEYLGRVDTMLNGKWGIRRIENRKIVGDPITDLKGEKRRLLLVHGTFSSTQSLIDGIATNKSADAFWTWTKGKYDEVLCFDHPTLSVSPILNALDLARAFTSATGSLDVISHSRGGLVARWFLDVMRAKTTKQRAVLVGSPCAGTALASPPRLKSTLSLLSNIGEALRVAGEAASIFQPWIAGPAALMRIVTSFTNALSSTPILDAAIALVPGLNAQSRVGNNAEILRLHEVDTTTTYFVVKSNFETENPGWKFWRHFRMTAIADRATNAIFDGENDLVVDSNSMTDLGLGSSRIAETHDFGTSASVHHTNYFSQRETLDKITEWLP